MSTVVAIQALLFQDGGITVLGTNILNMAILAPAAAALIHRLLRRLAVPASARCFLSAWFSVAAVALAGAFELALSGVVPFLLAAKVLLFWHALIGIGEGLITAVVIPFAERSSFELLSEKGKVAE